MYNYVCTKTCIELAISFLNLLVLAGGLWFAIWRFGLKRERYSFLNLSIEPKILPGVGEVKLVSLVIRLENIGETKITARTERIDGFLYSDDLDKCMHAGTLQIRPIPNAAEPLGFDWYSLSPIDSKILKIENGHVNTIRENLEQINFLGEYEDPNLHFKEVDFWIEPKETCVLHVPVWLRPGNYSAKAFFLGTNKSRHNDDFWSHTIIFQVPVNSPPNIDSHH